jgi:hypothetical protein
MRIKYDNGQPCEHKGCLNHITHPCEGCGRIGGQGIVYEEETQLDKFLERQDDQPDIDNDFIRGRRLTDKESMALMFQDSIFDEEEYKKAVKAFVKWK